MSPTLEKVIDQAQRALREQLGNNLISCCLYGSAVRGNFIEGQSDINLLIVVDVSDPAAHEAIARAIGGESGIDPFIIGRPDLERTMHAFAPKFFSIKRNYRVIDGPDLLSALKIDPAQERFLCEQGLRNLQLRTTYAFVTRARRNSYKRFLVRCVTPLFIQMSEVLRLEGVDIPNEFELRIPVFETHFQIKGEVLSDLLRLKAGTLTSASDESIHDKLFAIIAAVVGFVNKNWKGQ